ncbi:MAG TPA: hypothetical protein VH370_22135 [Humisphaera sp.]|jgi:hypothetical protein|nr:hypothetical protein [Humisphaera sp.]
MAKTSRQRGNFDEDDDASQLDLSDMVDQTSWTREDGTLAAGRQDPQQLQKQSVRLQEHSVALQEQANVLSAAQLQVAVASNELLGHIDSSLDQIGYGINQIHDDLARQEQLQREQLQKQDEHLRQQATHIDLTRQQLELQMQQTAKIERDRLVKELLYNLERYNKKLMKLTDPIARAYGARRLMDRLSIAKFTSKDLFEIADKRHFDDQTAAVNAVIESLNAEQQKILGQFEKAYGDYLRATGTDSQDDAALAGERLTFSEAAVKQARPRPPEHNGRPLDEATAKTLGELAKTCGKKRQVMSRLTIGAGTAAGVFALLTILLAMAAMKSGGIAVPLAISTALVTVVAVVLVACTPVRSKAAVILGEGLSEAESDEFKLTDRYGLTYEETDKLMTAWGQYSFAARAFDREFPHRLEQERTRIAAHNKAVDEMNTQRSTIVAQHKAKCATALGGLLKYINAFLDKHPEVKDWAPRPAA